MKEYFSEYTRLHDLVIKYENRWNDAKARLECIKIANYDSNTTSGGKPIGFDDIMANLEQLEKDYTITYKEYKSLKEKHLKEIDELEPIEAIIIEEIYINRKQLKYLGDILFRTYNINYAYSTIARLKKQAEDNFKKIIISKQ